MTDPQPHPLEQPLHRAGEQWTAAVAPDRARFLATFRERLAAEAESAPAAIIENPVPARVRPARPWGWAFAAAAAILLWAGVATRQALLPPQAVGNLLYRNGGVHAPAQLEAGARLATDAGARAVAALDGERVTLYLSASTTVRVRERDRVVVERGDLWVDIVPKSGFFEVETVHGRVVALGTRFGVRVGAGGTEVRIAEGKVSVEVVRGAANTLSPGSQAVIQVGAQEPSLTAAPQEATPPWVQQLREEYAGALASRYYPSGRPAGARP